MSQEERIIPHVFCSHEESTLHSICPTRRIEASPGEYFNGQLCQNCAVVIWKLQLKKVNCAVVIWKLQLKKVNCAVVIWKLQLKKVNCAVVIWKLQLKKVNCA